MAARLTYLESLRHGLHALLEADARVVVLGEDILDPYGGAFKVTQGLSTRFPGRVLTTPISEAAIVGLGVGLALRGRRPLVEIMFGDFVTLAADQLINHAAKYAAMYNGRVQVPLVVRTPMGGGRGYGPTHSQSLERLFLGIPHLTVLAPSQAHDPGALLRAAVGGAGPVLFVENKLLYPQPLLLGAGEGAIRRDATLDAQGFGTVRLANYGPEATPDVAVAAYGGMSTLLAPVLARLAEEEVRVLAVLPACISPLDSTLLVQAARAAGGRLLIVEESQAAFGWGAEVAAIVQAEVQGALVSRLGAQPTVIPAARPLEDAVLLTPRSIERALLALLGR
jgi:pyruvate/2-oxoglutarate/acetoin dehydrogenase E1 component